MPAVAASVGVFALAGWAARGREVSEAEARAYQTVNSLPAEAFPAVWATMQIGSLAGVFAAAGVAAGLRQRALAMRMLVAGTATWAGAKGLKHTVKRGRPATTVARSRILGQPQSGLGYPSGHAAVATTLASLTSPAVPARWRPLLWATAGTVAASRLYVGAHLPLDVVGGVALGYAVGTTAGRVPW